MPHPIWSTQHLRQCEERTGHGMLADGPVLDAFSRDFGGICHAQPAAVFSPSTTQALQQVVAYAHEHGLPLTVRAHGLSQGGQTVPEPGGLTLHMDQFRAVHAREGESIWVDANASWSELLAETLPHARVPYVTPYNTNLSVAGLISVGGVGAASFKHGIAASHVRALEVVTADGAIQRIGAESALFHACLGGLGQFGVITRAAIALKPCARQVRTYTLVYADEAQWLQDLAAFKRHADFIETVCTPALLGTRASPRGRQPFAQWLYAMQVSFEYDTGAPELASVEAPIEPWKIADCQDETMAEYLLRHNTRFHAMKLSGQWALQHPWYECLVPQQVALAELGGLLRSLPLYFATLVHVVPIARSQPSGFFMAPDQPEFVSLMILNPGVPAPLVPGCLDAIKALDERLLSQGGKRYASGFLGSPLPPGYWETHFGDRHAGWTALKHRYDPKGIFGSSLSRPSPCATLPA